MSKLRGWIEEQFGERKVEPNSALGQALRYVLRHWDGLTKFLTVAGAPLDNNVAERALKRAVLLRKNALFYCNEHGALVGEILLSLIETCRLNGVSAWKYLLALMRERSAARAIPDAYLPWNYARGEPKAACGFFRTEVRADWLIRSFFNLLGSSFKIRPTSEGG